MERKASKLKIFKNSMQVLNSSIIDLFKCYIPVQYYLHTKPAFFDQFYDI